MGRSLVPVHHTARRRRSVLHANRPLLPALFSRSLGPVVLGADLTRIVAAKTNTAALVVRGC